MNKLNCLKALAVPFLMVACSSGLKKIEVPAAASDYQSYSSGSFVLRPFKEVLLDNGLKIIFIHDTSLPRVSLSMFVRSGVIQDPVNLQGLNFLTSYMLAQGTQTRSATQLADSFGQLGSELSISPGSDFSMVVSDSLSTSKDELLKLFADVVQNPAFADAEISRLKSRIQASLKKKIDDPSSYADDKFDELIFANHPYAFDNSGTPDSVRKITKQNVIRHYLANFRPNNASLAVVGNFDATFEEQVKTAFEKWAKRTIIVKIPESVPVVSDLQIQLLTKKGLQQAQIRLGQVGIKRNDPDFLKLRVANEILGGGFSSRLNQKVRDDLGLTYSIESSFNSQADVGSFDISTFTKNESVAQTLREVMKVVENFVINGVTEKELESAKTLLIGQFPRAIETSDKTAFNILALDFYGIPKTYLTDYNKTIEKIRLKDVNEAIKKHISAKNFKVLIYADPKIAVQLKDYKIETKVGR